MSYPDVLALVVAIVGTVALLWRLYRFARPAPARPRWTVTASLSRFRLKATRARATFELEALLGDGILDATLDYRRTDDYLDLVLLIDAPTPRAAEDLARARVAGLRAAGWPFDDVLKVRKITTTNRGGTPR